jgi:hypothetical protein
MKVKEILFNSFRILKEKPKFLLPYLIVLILIGVLWQLIALPDLKIIEPEVGSEIFTWYVASISILGVITFVIAILALGMYPSMVKNYMEKKEINLKESLRFSYYKFFSLLGVSLLIGLIIVAIEKVFEIIPFEALDILAFPIERIAKEIVRCSVLAFFFYLPPTIVMENVLAWKGIKKSVGVAKRNYPFTFLILLIPTIIWLAAGRILFRFRAYLGVNTNYILLIPLIISLFIGTWIMIIMSYAYYKLRG